MRGYGPSLQLFSPESPSALSPCQPPNAPTAVPALHQPLLPNGRPPADPGLPASQIRLLPVLIYERSAGLLGMACQCGYSGAGGQRLGEGKGRGTS